MANMRGVAIGLVASAVAGLLSGCDRSPEVSLLQPEPTETTYDDGEESDYCGVRLWSFEAPEPLSSKASELQSL